MERSVFAVVIDKSERQAVLMYTHLTDPPFSPALLCRLDVDVIQAFIHVHQFYFVVLYKQVRHHSSFFFRVEYQTCGGDFARDVTRLCKIALGQQ